MGGDSDKRHNSSTLQPTGRLPTNQDAFNKGLSKDDIREVLLQTAVYCGVPAAIDSFRGAREVFKEMGI